MRRLVHRSPVSANNAGSSRRGSTNSPTTSQTTKPDTAQRIRTRASTDRRRESGDEVGGLFTGQNGRRQRLPNDVRLTLLNDRLDRVALCRGHGREVMVPLDGRAVIRIDGRAASPAAATQSILVGSADTPSMDP